MSTIAVASAGKIRALTRRVFNARTLFRFSMPSKLCIADSGKFGVTCSSAGAGS